MWELPQILDLQLIVGTITKYKKNHRPMNYRCFAIIIKIESLFF